jgi:hypothetical protein
MAFATARSSNDGGHPRPEGVGRAVPPQPTIISDQTAMVVGATTAFGGGARYGYDSSLSPHATYVAWGPRFVPSLSTRKTGAPRPAGPGSRGPPPFRSPS